jgi:hypothetical protein
MIPSDQKGVTDGREQNIDPIIGDKTTGSDWLGTLRYWWKQILNYFPGGFNNGLALGVNLKIKMLNRHGFGYRNFKSFRLHLLVAFLPFPVKRRVCFCLCHRMPVLIRQSNLLLTRYSK